MTELQPTVPAGDGDPTSREGYGAAKIAAEQVLLDHGAPVTVLRPSKVYGVGIGRPREWFVVRRALDGRERILLADGGRGVDHTTAASGIASLVRIVADAPDRRILNVADETAPSVLEIVRTVAGLVDHRFDEVLLDQTRRRSSDDPVELADAVRARHHRRARPRLAAAAVTPRPSGPRSHGCWRPPTRYRRAATSRGRRTLLGADVRLRPGGRRAAAAGRSDGTEPVPRSEVLFVGGRSASGRPPRPRHCTTCWSPRTSGTRSSRATSSTSPTPRRTSSTPRCVSPNGTSRHCGRRTGSSDTTGSCSRTRCPSSSGRPWPPRWGTTRWSRPSCCAPLTTPRQVASPGGQVAGSPRRSWHTARRRPEARRGHRGRRHPGGHRRPDPAAGRASTRHPGRLARVTAAVHGAARPQTTRPARCAQRRRGRLDP